MNTWESLKKIFEKEIFGFPFWTIVHLIILIFYGIYACKVKYMTKIVRISEVGSMELELNVLYFSDCTKNDIFH